MCLSIRGLALRKCLDTEQSPLLGLMVEEGT